MNTKSSLITPSEVVPMAIIDANEPERFIHECLMPEQPAIVAGIAKDWPATSRWSIAYFIEKYGQASVPLSYYKGRGQERYTAQETMLLGDYLSQVQDGHSPNTTSEASYVAGWVFSKDFPELLEDINSSSACFSDNWLPRIPSSISLPTTTLFFGHKDVSSPLHTDSFFVNTWLTMIAGEKTVRMVSPVNSTAVANGMDIFDETTADTILKKGVEIQEGTAKPTDAIFIPPGWWHNVINSDVNIAVQNLYVDTPRFPLFEQQMRRLFMPTLEKLGALGKEARKVLASSQHNNQVIPSREVSAFVAHEQQFIRFLRDWAREMENHLHPPTLNL